MDSGRRKQTSRRASIGLEQFSSIASSRDGRHLAATVQKPQSSLWSVPLRKTLTTDSDTRLVGDLSGIRALAPRLRGESIYFLSSRGSGDGLWRLHLLSADGAQLRLLSGAVDARGAPDWSPDGSWVVTGGTESGVEGLFKIPVTGGAPVRIESGEALNPVWSPDGKLIVYAGPQVNNTSPLLGVAPDGTQVELPTIEVLRGGERMRFLPDGSGLVYMQGLQPSQDFWLLDLRTGDSRRLTQFKPAATMRSFDITPDGEHIVFDRLTLDSDVVMIELGSLN